ncbi:MAG TPA: histidine kinase [Bacillota bacterium]
MLFVVAGVVGAAQGLLLWTAAAELREALLAAATGAVLAGGALAWAVRRGPTTAPRRTRRGSSPPPPTAPATWTTKALRWLQDTRAHVREGLAGRTGLAVARAVLDLTGAAAVTITEQDRVVACAGEGGRDIRPGQPSACPVVAQASASGRPALGPWVRARPGRPPGLGAAAPIRVRGEPAGVLALYFQDGFRPAHARRLCIAVAGAVGLLVEAADLERKAAEVARFRLQALRAQINPHFLYNVLTAVIVRVRTDPEEARRLLIRLADFFRYMYTVQTDAQLVPFSAELAFVRTYLHLERARFGERLHVVYDIDPQILGVPVPALTIQPLVENAVKHGIIPKLGPGTVILRARTDLLAMRAYVEVRDNGVGAAPGTVRDALVGKAPAHGIGLANIRERLEYLYGPRSSMVIDSRPGVGTRVRLSLPVVRRVEASSPVDLHVR